MISGAAPAQDVSSLRRPLWGDERLALRVAEGDDRAFATLYQRYHQRLFRYCISILRDEPDAHDALQSTFERALTALRREQRNAPLRPWLFRIAHNEAITVLRRRPSDQPPAYVGVLTASSAEHVAGEREELASLIADLAQLPERPRSALVMRELEGLSHEDIAIALDTTVAAARQAIFEARRALAEAAEGREMSCAEIQQLVSDGDGRVLRGRRVSAHLRSCAACSAFVAAIPRRRAHLRALAPPLAPIAAASILARAHGGLAAHGSLSAAAGSSSVGKGALAAAAGSKMAAGAAVIATATAGVAGVATLAPLVSHRQHAHRATVAAPRRAASAPGGVGSSASSAAATGHRPVLVVPTAGGSAVVRAGAHPGSHRHGMGFNAASPRAASAPHGVASHGVGQARGHTASSSSSNAAAKANGVGHGSAAHSNSGRHLGYGQTSVSALKRSAKHTTAPASGGQRGHAATLTGPPAKKSHN
jgi:RNA polymerase sigma factor (sigma-70 family)